MGGGGEGVGVRAQQPVGPPDAGAQHQSAGGEQAGRGEEGPADPVDRGVGDTGLAPEGAPDEADGVRDGQHRARHRDGQRPAVRGVAVHQRVEGGLFRGEAEQRGQCGHGGGGDHGDGAHVRQRPPHAGESAQVPGARGVVDDAGDEEQRRLEQGVTEDHDGGGQRRIAVADAGEQGEEAELADGAVGQDELQVVEPQGPPAAEQHRRGAEDHHDGPPDGYVGEAGSQPGNQVDAGLDHGRGVQVRADGCGRGHGVREPEAERPDRRFRQGTAQDQDHGHGDGEARSWRVGDDRGDAVGARHLTDDQEADQHGQSAEGGDGERLECGATAVPLLAVESDQQVGEDRGQLPEHIERDQVVTEDEGEHGTGEGEQVSRESRQSRGVVAEVGGAVEQDERADARREQHHEFGERVQAQGDGDVVRGDPGPRPADRGARGGGVPLGERPAGGGCGRQREDHEGARAEPPHQRAGARGEDEVADDERGHAASRRAPRPSGEEARGPATRAAPGDAARGSAARRITARRVTGTVVVAVSARRDTAPEVAARPVAAPGGVAREGTEQTMSTKYRYIPGPASPVRRAAPAAAHWDQLRPTLLRPAPDGRAGVEPTSVDTWARIHTDAGDGV